MKIQYRSDNLVVFESALFRTTTSLIIADDHLLLIDPNWLPIELEFIRDYVQPLQKGKECFLFFTHSDYDHIIGYQTFRNWTMIASRNFVNQKNKTAIIDKIIALDDDNYVQRKYPVVYPEIDIVLEEDDTELSLGNSTYEVTYALGHNDDSIFLLDPEHEVLIAGDYLSNIEFPYVYHSFKEYDTTLDKFKKRIDSNRIKLLVPGHGDFTTDFQDMRKREEDARWYLQELKRLGIDFPFKEYVTRYDFPQVMLKFHQANLDLLKKEFG